MSQTPRHDHSFANGLIAALLTRHRWLPWLFVLGLTAIAAVGLSRLEFDDDPRNLLRTRSPGYQTMVEAFDDFGADDADVVLVIEGDDLFSATALSALRAIVEDAKRIVGVERVDSIFDARRTIVRGVQIPLIPTRDLSEAALAQARQRALEHPLVRRQLLSDDARTTLVLVRIVGHPLKMSEIRPVVEGLREIESRLDPTSRLTMRMTGVPVIRMETVASIQHDLVLFNVVGGALAIAIAYTLFRRWTCVFLAAAAPSLGAVWVLGLFGLVHVPIDVFNCVVPTLVMVVGLTDSVHFLVDIQRSVAERPAALESSIGAIQKVGAACGLTSVTTAIGFASLAVAGSPVIRQFGLACAAGSVLTFVAVIVMVPLLASHRWLGMRLAAHRQASLAPRRFADGVVRFAIRHAALLAIVGIVATVAMAAVGTRLIPDTKLTEDIPANSESAMALARCDEAFGGVMLVYAVVEWPQEMPLSDMSVHDALAEVHELFDGHDLITEPVSILSVAQTMSSFARTWPAQVARLERLPPESIDRLVRLDKHRALVRAHTRDVGSSVLNVAIARLTGEIDEIERRHPGISIQLTGSTVVSAQSINQIITDLGNSLGVESVIIFGLMAWAFRSLALGLITIVPNVFPLVAVATLIVALGMPLRMGSVIVFNICLGLAVDDTIHVMTRFSRLLGPQVDVNDAIRESFAEVGTAILTTTCILLAGFGTVTLSQLPGLRLFGYLSCFTILTALVAELLFLPALLAAFFHLRGTAWIARKVHDRHVAMGDSLEMGAK